MGASYSDSRLLAAHSGPRADVSAVLALMQPPHLCSSF